MNVKISVAVITAVAITSLCLFKIRPDKGVEVRVTAPVRGAMTSLISATGKVVCGQESAVASPVASKAVKVLVQEGQTVPRGSLLVVLDGRDASNRINADTAMAGEAQAKVEQAERALQTTKKIYDVGGVSLSALQDAELQVTVARAAEKKAASEVRSAALFLERFKILAPFAGIIVKKSVQAGDVVASGAPLLVLADMSRREIEVAVDESDAGSLQVGQEVEVSCEALANRTWKEKILRIDPAVHRDGTANTLKTHVSLRKNLPELRLGQQLDVKIKIAEKKDVVKLPFDAVMLRDGKKQLATVRDGKVHFEPVVTGLEDATAVEILSPVRLDAEVILSEGKTLREGERVSRVTSIGK